MDLLLLYALLYLTGLRPPAGAANEFSPVGQPDTLVTQNMV